MQQVALVDREPPVQHVDAQEMLQARLRCLVVRAEGGRAGDVDATRDEIADVVEQLLHLVAGEQAADDQEALLAEVDVLVDGDLLHAVDARAGPAARRWPECACCCPRLIR